MFLSLSHLKANESNLSGAALAKVIKKLQYYPLIILIAWGPTTISDSLFNFNPSAYSAEFAFVSMLFACSQGLMTGLTFIWSHRHEWSHWQFNFNPHAKIDITGPITPIPKIDHSLVRRLGFDVVKSRMKTVELLPSPGLVAAGENIEFIGQSKLLEMSGDDIWGEAIEDKKKSYWAIANA